MPEGLNFPLGVVDVAQAGCGHGARISLRWVYPNALPAKIHDWKYGPAPDDLSTHAYPMPADTVQIDGHAVTLTLTDGPLGDDDLSVNGSIVDISGLAVPTALAGAAPPSAQDHDGFTAADDPPPCHALKRGSAPHAG